MPTCYTDCIKNDISFRDFATQCARNFGATIHMRDDKITPVLVDRVVDDYHIEQIASYTKKLIEYDEMTLDECAAEIIKMNEENRVAFEKRAGEKMALALKYTAMLCKVKAWNPPTTEHQGLKDFMIQQIQDSIKWDCENCYSPSESTYTPQEYKEMMIDDCKKNIEYHQKRHAEEVKCVEEANKWMKDLKESLK